jgi:formylmethanofuran dehydrogenase subunit E
MADWKDYLKKAQAFHGHLCSGQILGIRMALAAIKELEVKIPNRDLMLFLETDRCLADAAMLMTGLTFGTRRIKFKDYGKAAFTLLDLKSARAVRVLADAVVRPAKDEKNLVEFWDGCSDDQIMTMRHVEVSRQSREISRRKVKRVRCGRCAEEIADNKYELLFGEILCRACADESYYQVLD